MIEHDTWLKDEPKCPHCAHEHRELIDFVNDRGIVECEECEQPFTYERVVTIHYTTKKPATT